MDEHRPDNGGNNNNKKRNGQSIFWMVVITLVVLLMVSSLTNRVSSLTNQEITYTEFMNMVEEGEVDEVVFTSGQIQIKPKEQQNALYQTTYHTVNLGDDRLYEFLDEHNVEYTGKSNNTSNVIWQILSIIIPIALIWGVFAFAMRRMGGSGGIMGVGKSTAKMYVEKSTGVTFRDVAGQDEAKETLQEMVDFLNNPNKYTAIGAKLPKGALLVGPSRYR